MGLGIVMFFRLAQDFGAEAELHLQFLTHKITYLSLAANAQKSYLPDSPHTYTAIILNIHFYNRS